MVIAMKVDINSCSADDTKHRLPSYKRSQERTLLKVFQSDRSARKGAGKLTPTEVQVMPRLKSLKLANETPPPGVRQGRDTVTNELSLRGARPHHSLPLTTKTSCT
jgi:hypothetical protein